MTFNNRNKPKFHIPFIHTQLQASVANHFQFQAGVQAALQPRLTLKVYLVPLTADVGASSCFLPWQDTADGFHFSDKGGFRM